MLSWRCRNCRGFQARSRHRHLWPCGLCSSNNRRWYHGWDKEKDFDQVAGSLIAGHLIECSSYVCGGYYSGFKDLSEGCENIGFPIAEIFADGSCAIIKELKTGGEISVGSVASQLLYEIQGPQYYGSDVVAVLEDINMVQEGKDRVLVSGIKGKPPPTTTNVGITATGGYQAEFKFFFVSLDLEQKAEWTENRCDTRWARMSTDLMLSSSH
jgi:hypothetical protein